MYNIIVSVPSSDLRALAREALRGKWVIASIATLIYAGIVILPPYILNGMFGETSTIGSFYTIIITGAMTYGYSLFMMNIFRNKETNNEQLFYGFEMIVKTIGLYLYMMLFIILWLFLFIIPGIIAGIRYSQSFYILIDNPHMSIPEIVNESKRMMTGNKMKYFCLNLSFIGWAILAAIPGSILMEICLSMGASNFIAGLANLAGSVGYLVLSPYMLVATVAMYEIMAGNLKPGIIQVEPEAVNTYEDSGNTLQ